MNTLQPRHSPIQFVVHRDTRPTAEIARKNKLLEQDMFRFVRDHANESWENVWSQAVVLWERARQMEAQLCEAWRSEVLRLALETATAKANTLRAREERLSRIRAYYGSDEDGVPFDHRVRDDIQRMHDDLARDRSRTCSPEPEVMTEWTSKDLAFFDACALRSQC